MFGLATRPSNFDSYLLGIAIMNLLLYLGWYITFKFVSGEGINIVTLLLILFTSVIWGFALYFFKQHLTTWEETPAESREHNKNASCGLSLTIMTFGTSCRPWPCSHLFWREKEREEKKERKKEREEREIEKKERERREREREEKNERREERGRMRGERKRESTRRERERERRERKGEREEREKKER
ncbi:hypothetical protein WMY93_000457 [Mugilogobius chulae]|uniref:Uncharacterized protein n=1 Tax=Mugilogobius chulae TaxID=88201 RepID=A0AAW0Q539_9GOBI